MHYNSKKVKFEQRLLPQVLNHAQPLAALSNRTDSGRVKCKIEKMTLKVLKLRKKEEENKFAEERKEWQE